MFLAKFVLSINFDCFVALSMSKNLFLFVLKMFLIKLSGKSS